MLRAVVIGNGPLGSAAGRHLAEAGCDVTVMGSTRLTSSSQDRGRIARALDAEGNAVWAKRNAESVSAFRQLEKDTGVPFYTECGALVVGSEAFAKRAAQGVVDVERWGDRLAGRFPFLATNVDDFAALDAAAGHVDPMAMVAAQNAKAQHHGARILNDATVGELQLISGDTEGSRQSVVAITAADHQRVEADIAVVCAGAYTVPLLSASGLSCTPLLAGVRVSRRTVLMAEVSEEDATGALANMPTLKYLVQPGTKSAPDGHSATEAASVYVLPPIRYPEYGDRWFVKIGGGPNDFFDDDVNDIPGELASFYSTDGDTALAARLEPILRHALPTVNFGEIFSKPCVTTCSSDGALQLAALAGGSVIAATGCQGKAAMCADAIGREIAQLCLERNS